MRRQRGFTVTELMVTVGILGILVAAAGPGYQDFIANSRMTSQSSEFVSALHFARSEAVKRNATITLCKSANGAGCATSGNWGQGWIIFVDGTTNGTVDGSDLVLRVHEALSGGSSMLGATAVESFVSYRSNGLAVQTGQLNLCSRRNVVTGRGIQVTAGTGLPRVVTDPLVVSCS